MPVFITTSDIYTQIWIFILKNCHRPWHMWPSMLIICAQYVNLYIFETFLAGIFSNIWLSHDFYCIYHTKIIKNVENGHIVRGIAKSASGWVKKYMAIYCPYLNIYTIIVTHAWSYNISKPQCNIRLYQPDKKPVIWAD